MGQGGDGEGRLNQEGLLPCMNFVGKHLLTEIPQFKKKPLPLVHPATLIFACVIEANDSLQMRFRIFLPQRISL